MPRREPGQKGYFMMDNCLRKKPRKSKQRPRKIPERHYYFVARDVDGGILGRFSTLASAVRRLPPGKSA
jgi:hypothetical protein